MRRKNSSGFNPRGMINSLHEWESTQFSLKPRRIMLLFILIFNILLVLLSAWVISAVAIRGNENVSFFTAVYNTFTMILDAGCIEAVISDPGSTNIFLVIFCLVIIVICMITFTGALIGYATNVISNLIENANANSVGLRISEHVVILGWNTRASEMINDLLYCRTKQKVVVLSDFDREMIITEVSERLKHTIKWENSILARRIHNKSWIMRTVTYQKKKLRNNISVIVREGDIFSSLHLHNIQLEKAKSIIILGKDPRRSLQYGASEEEEEEKGDNRTIKTLIQVVHIVSRGRSRNDQKVVVEIENEWTGDLVEKIIQAKQRNGKCHIVPFRVHTVMGQILSQFSLMPELNKVYSRLISNKDTSFFAVKHNLSGNTMTFVENYMNTHRRSLPLLPMKDEKSDAHYFYYMADNEQDLDLASDRATAICPLKLNPDYWLSERYVLILGSNSRMKNVMDGYTSFNAEWTDSKHAQIIQLTLVDEESKLGKAGYYKQYPFVERCIPARITEKDKINDIIKDFVYQHPDNSSILILSDDTVADDDIDAKMMAYLILSQNVINRARQSKRDERFNIDIIAEVMDPRHADLVRSYDVDNVIISNRYISKMVTQISEDYARYNLYSDIMNYDEMKTGSYDGIEIYIKKAGDYFDELPPRKTSVDVLVRSVFEASRRFWGSENDYAILLGYFDSRGKMTLFGGDREKQVATITEEDKLILFSNH